MLTGTNSTSTTLPRACIISDSNVLSTATLADIEAVLASSGLSSEPSTVSAAGCSSSSVCSEEHSSSRSSSLSQCSTSSGDLASLSGYCQRDSHQCLTSDGWKLHIMHVYDATAEASSSGSRRPQHPVLMVPGLASSGEHTFDLLPDYSLANALVARGYDVWMADLRGAHNDHQEAAMPAQAAATFTGFSGNSLTMQLRLE